MNLKFHEMDSVNNEMDKSRIYHLNFKLQAMCFWLVLYVQFHAAQT